MQGMVASIRAARVAAGLSQQQVADQLGLTRSSVANMEAGRQEIGVVHLAALVRALHLDPAALLGLVSLPPRPHVVTIEPVLTVSCTTCGGVVLDVTPSRYAAGKARDEHVAEWLRKEAEDLPEVPGD